mgnify:CR=1 FL=1
MGIHKLMSLLREKAPNSIKEFQMENLTGNIVACDASMVLNLDSLSLISIGHVSILGYDPGL